MRAAPDKAHAARAEHSEIGQWLDADIDAAVHRTRTRADDAHFEERHARDSAERFTAVFW